MRGGGIDNSENENLEEGDADTKATTYTITINPNRHYIKTTASIQFVASGTVSGRCSLGSSISEEVTSGSRYSISFSANASGSPDLRCSPSSASGTANGNKSISVLVSEYFTLTYSSGGGYGSMSSQSAMYSGFYSVASCSFYRTNYAFSHWRGSDGNTYNPGNSIRVTGDFTLTAVWTFNPPPVYYYDVTYSGNGATGGSTSGHYNVEEDTSITLRECGFTRTGYTFVEWNTNSSGTGTGYDPGDSYEVNYDEVLYAIWRINTYTISFNGNGATSGSMSSQTKTYGVTLTLRTNTYARTGYNFLGWSTSSAATSPTWDDGDSYTTNASDTLYAVWEAKIIPVSLNWSGGSGGTSTIYLKYNSGWYSNSTATNAITSITKPTRAGFTFNGYNTASNGTGTTLINSSGEITASSTYYSTDGTKTIYAQWRANNPAYYDEEGGYWYIENGRLPQTRVSGSLKTILQSSWGNLETGSTYTMDATGDMVAKIYGGNEYCTYNGEYYLVEPIRWRLTYNANQEVGYGVSYPYTSAIMDTIVYAGRYSTEELGAGDGYKHTAVNELMNNQISTTYFVPSANNIPSFGTGGNLNGANTSNPYVGIKVASRSNIMSVAGDYSVKFSDLVLDYLYDNGSIPLYYTCDIGTNYNQIICLTEDGQITQRQPNLNYLGVQFKIFISQYACVER